MTSQDTNAWFEDELRQLRAREAHYRKELGRHWALSVRLREHTRALHQLLRRSPPRSGNLSRTLVDVARLSAQALQVPRTSVWLYDADRTALDCFVELRDLTEVPSGGQRLQATDYPAYVAAINREDAVAVSDANSDPRTCELLDYLREHCVGALLDIPIMIPGDQVGVLCHEHVGGIRDWDAEEIDFASNVASLVALSLESERRAMAEMAAAGLEAKYQHLVESLPVTVYSFSYRHRNLEYVSPQGVELGEYASVADALDGGAAAWLARVHPDDHGFVQERLLMGGVVGGLPVEVLYRLKLPSGRQKWVRDTGRVVRRADGQPVSVQGILADVTAQVEAETSKREFERRYLSMLSNVDLVAVSLDGRGHITFANDAFANLSGCDRERLVGVDFFERFFAPTDCVANRTAFVAGMKSGTLPARQELNVQFGQDRRRLLCSHTVLRDPSGEATGSVTLALDVTEQHAQQEALYQHAKLDGLTRLAAGVAHDFNNLLVVLMAQTSLLRDGIATNEEATYDSIDQALNQAAELTRSLLTYARQQPREHHRVRIDTAIRDTEALLKSLTRGDVTLILTLEAPDAAVRIDPTELRQVLINLVGNASDALADGGGSIRVATHVELLSEPQAHGLGLATGGEWMILRVIDDGPGVDQAILGKLFEPFFTTKAAGRGTGLGLAISQAVVTGAGGKIAVESQVGHGTTFTLLLPVCASSTKPH